jgi:hypothetical protein
MRVFHPFLTGLLCALVAGCAQPAKVWVSKPTARILERPPFRITISPQKRNSAAYNAFSLDMENTSPQPIAIDWNRSFLSDRWEAGRAFRLCRNRSRRGESAPCRWR